MTYLSAFVFAQVDAPGIGIVDRLKESIVAFGQGLVFVVAVLVCLVILLSLMPRWASAVLALMFVASLFYAADAWWDWLVYVAAGDGTETTADEPDTTSDGVEGGG